MTVDAIINFVGKPEIVAVILTATFALIGRMLQPKANVIWGVGHQFAHNIPQNAGGSLSIYSRSIYIQNIGKETAHSVEVYFSSKPEHYQIWPPCNYSELTLPDNHFVIKIDYLGAKEYHNIELLQSYSAPPFMVKLRTVDGDCKQVQMAPRQIFSKWINWSIIGLLLLGVYKISEWMLNIIKFI